MIEANENIDLVTMRRQQEMRRAQEDYRKAVSEGRLAVRPRPGEAADGRAALVAPLPPSGEATGVTVPADASARRPYQADPEAAWRQTRLAITAGLVLLLLVVWIWQKKSGR